MAKAKETTEEATVVKKEVQKSETEYTVSDFAKAAKQVFGAEVTPDLVTAAFAVNKLTSATKTKAKEIVADFIKKEVK